MLLFWWYKKGWEYWFLFLIIKIYDGTRYLELFCSWLYNTIFNMINCLIGEKSDAEYIINHNFAKIRLDSYL